MKPYKGFLFDLNGTMIDDMQYHITAWHKILNDLGANISFGQMKAECYGKNDELLERMLPGKFTAEQKAVMSMEKEKTYQAHFKPSLKLLPGLFDFLQKAKQQHIRMAIGSAAIMFNIDFVLDNLDIRSYFDVLVSADDIKVSKPDPETYLTCAEQLKLQPEECIVFEDAPKGVESAARAGMKAVVITTMHTEADFNAYDNILFFVNDFTDKKLDDLFSTS